MWHKLLNNLTRRGGARQGEGEIWSPAGPEFKAFSLDGKWIAWTAAELSANSLVKQISHFVEHPQNALFAGEPQHFVAGEPADLV
jgi:hypothetical protein